MLISRHLPQRDPNKVPLAASDQSWIRISCLLWTTAVRQLFLASRDLHACRRMSDRQFCNSKAGLDLDLDAGLLPIQPLHLLLTMDVPLSLTCLEEGVALVRSNCMGKTYSRLEET